MGKRYVTLLAINMAETELAVFLDVEGEEVWIPKSQLEDWPDDGEEGDAIMTEWIAFENGLI